MLSIHISVVNELYATRKTFVHFLVKCMLCTEIVFQSLDPLLLPPANEVWGKVIFSEMCVKNSVHRGVYLSACWDTIPRDQAPPWDQAPPDQPPPDQAPPGPGTPQIRHPPPPEQSMLGDTVNEQAVRILLECNLVYDRFKLWQRSFTQKAVVFCLNSAVTVFIWSQTLNVSPWDSIKWLTHEMMYTGIQK